MYVPPDGSTKISCVGGLNSGFSISAWRSLASRSRLADLSWKRYVINAMSDNRPLNATPPNANGFTSHPAIAAASALENTATKYNANTKLLASAAREMSGVVPSV